MAFGWGSDSGKVRDFDVAVLTKRLEAAGLDLGYYTPSVQKAAFSLPCYIEKLLPQRRLRGLMSRVNEVTGSFDGICQH